MTDQQYAELRKLAAEASKNGEHIYTHPRDSNDWKANQAWHAAAAPEAFIALLEEIASLQGQVEERDNAYRAAIAEITELKAVQAAAPANGVPQVSIEKLEDWKRRVNTLATCGLKADRYRVGSALKQEIADAITAQPAAQGMDAQTAYEAECFRWLRDKALDVWKKGPVVFMTDADGCPGSGGELTNNILTGKKLEQAIPVAAQAKQGEQP